MARGVRWGRAVLCSCILHAVLVVMAGVLVHQSQANRPDTIEVEMVRDTFATVTKVSLPDPLSETALRRFDGQTASLVAAMNAAAVGGQAAQMPVATGMISGDGQQMEHPLLHAGTAVVGVTKEPVTAAGSGSMTSGQTRSLAPLEAGGGGGQVQPHTVVPPRVLQAVQPDYPEQAREQGIEGTVRLRVQVLVNGTVGEVTIRSSSGNALLDAAAVHAARTFRFIPGCDEQSGEAITCYTSLPVVFALR